MERLFRIRCSQIGKIMGRVGLTENQYLEFEKLGKQGRTAIQEKRFQELYAKHINPELPETCKTYLHTWYANENEQIHSKYIDKGIEVEGELIDFMAEQLGFGMAEKNRVRVSDEFMEGECDVDLPTCVVDVKASWNKKTLQQVVIDGYDKDYEYQLQGYMHLYNKPTAYLFYGLMNTPETDWQPEIVYDDMPANERWIAFKFDYDIDKITAIKERVEQCRAYLIEYDKKIKSKLGKIN